MGKTIIVHFSFGRRDFHWLWIEQQNSRAKTQTHLWLVCFINGLVHYIEGAFIQQLLDRQKLPLRLL